MIPLLLELWAIHLGRRPGSPLTLNRLTRAENGSYLYKSRRGKRWTMTAAQLLRKILTPLRSSSQLAGALV